MVLPLLGSFLGSAILPGMFGSALSPLAAGAIGSGIGSLLQGDDLDEAIGTGLTSFMGGKLLGGLGKEFAKGDGGIKDLINPKMANQIKPADISNALQGTEGAKSALQSTIKTGMDLAKTNPFTTTGLVGGAMLANAANQQPDMEGKKDTFRPRETVPIQQNIKQPPPGYRPGIDPEFNYGFRNPTAGELETRFIQEGGIAALAPTAAPPNEKDLIVNAVNAVNALTGLKTPPEPTKPENLLAPDPPPRNIFVNPSLLKIPPNLDPARKVFGLVNPLNIPAKPDPPARLPSAPAPVYNNAALPIGDFAIFLTARVAFLTSLPKPYICLPISSI